MFFFLAVVDFLESFEFLVLPSVRIVSLSVVLSRDFYKTDTFYKLDSRVTSVYAERYNPSWEAAAPSEPNAPPLCDLLSGADPGFWPGEDKDMPSGAKVHIQG